MITKLQTNFLDNFSNVKGLKKVQSENIGTLIRDAYGRRYKTLKNLRCKQ